jgi:glycosyltransferase involved in cell wall biosynthesis
MSDSWAAPKVIILNNEIMPYRIPLFKRLAERGKYALKVLYSTKRSDERQWSLKEADLDFPYSILKAWTFRLAKPNYGEWRSIWFNPSLFFELFHEKPAAIIAYEYSLPAFTAYLYSKISGSAFLIWSEMTPHSSRNLSLGQRFMRRLLLAHVESVIGTSKAACDYFRAQSLSDEMIFLAPQTLNVLFWKEKAETQKKEHPPTVLYVGYLNERKGVRHLIKAFRFVHQRMPHARLLLAGAGDLQGELERLASEMGNAVHFLGFCEPELLPEIYAEADVFVLPSLEDTFGVVAAEALASGLPLIVSPYAGISSHLEHERNAFIIEPTQHEALAEAMQGLLADKALAKRFVEESQGFLDSLSPEYNTSIFETALAFSLAQRKRYG